MALEVDLWCLSVAFGCLHTRSRWPHIPQLQQLLLNAGQSFRAMDLPGRWVVSPHPLQGVGVLLSLWDRFCLAYLDFWAADLDGIGGGIGLGGAMWRCDVDWSVVSRLASLSYLALRVVRSSLQLKFLLDGQHLPDPQSFVLQSCPQRSWLKWCMSQMSMWCRTRRVQPGHVVFPRSIWSIHLGTDWWRLKLLAVHLLMDSFDCNWLDVFQELLFDAWV